MKKSQKNKLDGAFNKQKDEIETWNPEDKGDTFVGSITGLDVSITHGTPYLVFQKDGKIPVSVYVKKGMISFFTRKGYLTKEETWKDDTNLVGQTIAIRYEGKQKNPNTKQTFHKYKVIFQEELIELGVIDNPEEKEDKEDEEDEEEDE